jgi:hypothetical protein
MMEITEEKRKMHNEEPDTVHTELLGWLGEEERGTEHVGSITKIKNT